MILNGILWKIFKKSFLQGLLSFIPQNVGHASTLSSIIEDRVEEVEVNVFSNHTLLAECTVSYFLQS